MVMVGIYQKAVFFVSVLPMKFLNFDMIYLPSIKSCHLNKSSYERKRLETCLDSFSQKLCFSTPPQIQQFQFWFQHSNCVIQAVWWTTKTYETTTTRLLISVLCAGQITLLCSAGPLPQLD